MADEPPEGAKEAAPEVTPEGAEGKAEEAPEVGAKASREGVVQFAEAGGATEETKEEKKEETKEEELEPVVVVERKKRPKVAWSDDLSHDSEEDRGICSVSRVTKLSFSK